MPALKLNLISLGRARDLTRDGLGTQYIEMQVRNGRWPTEG